MNPFEARFGDDTDVSGNGPPTVRLQVYQENFDDPNSETRLQIEELLSSGKLEAFLIWIGFDLKTLSALAMDSLGTRQEQDLDEISEGWRQIDEIQRRLRGAQDRARLLREQSARLSRLRELVQ